MKRLAKLGGQPTANGEPSAPPRPASSSPIPSTPQPEDSQPAQQAETPKTSDLPKANPFAQLGVKADSKAPPRINIKPKPTLSQNGDGSTDVRPRSQQGSRDSIEIWEDRTLNTIFRLSLDPSTTRDAHGHRVYYLPSVRSDLEDEGVPVQLNISILDQAILEAASNLQEEEPLDYLLGCWKRVSRIFRGMRSNDPRFGILKEARRLCFSYCIFAVTIPDMFGQEPSPVNSLAERLLVDSEHDRGICHDFLSEAVSRFDEDESVKEALVGAMEQLSRELSKLSMNDDYKPYILVFAAFPANTTFY
jgi:ubiquitin conjugation factor E4 B